MAGQSNRIDEDHLITWSLFLAALGPILAAGFGAIEHQHGWAIIPVGIAISLGSAGLGSLLGLLFGVPRALAHDTPVKKGANPSDDSSGAGADGSQVVTHSGNAPGYAGNTNLEQVSDWLTKILLGAGLTQLGRVPSGLGALATYLSPGLGGGPEAKPFAVSLVLFGLLSGFFVGFLSARLLLGRAFQRADQLANVYAKTTNEIQQLDPLSATRTGAVPDAAAEDYSPEKRRDAKNLYQRVVRVEDATDDQAFSRDQYLRVAQQLIGARLWDEAVATLEEAFNANPRDPSPLVYAGAIRSRHQNAYDEAERLYFRALAVKPDFADAFYNLACNEVRRRRPDAARAYLERAFSIAPGLREYAKTDDVWDSVRDHPSLRDLLAGTGPSTRSRAPAKKRRPRVKKASPTAGSRRR